MSNTQGERETGRKRGRRGGGMERKREGGEGGKGKGGGRRSDVKHTVKMILAFC